MNVLAVTKTQIFPAVICFYSILVIPATSTATRGRNENTQANRRVYQFDSFASYFLTLSLLTRQATQFPIHILPKCASKHHTRPKDTIVPEDIIVF